MYIAKWNIYVSSDVSIYIIFKLCGYKICGSSVCSYVYVCVYVHLLEDTKERQSHWKADGF